ncbi:hypothetical protein C84B14_16733 [Salinisphaera sp. C84B14]
MATKHVLVARACECAGTERLLVEAAGNGGARVRSHISVIHATAGLASSRLYNTTEIRVAAHLQRCPRSFGSGLRSGHWLGPKMDYSTGEFSMAYKTADVIDCFDAGLIAWRT